jgi:serine/threonine-protein kinase
MSYLKQFGILSAVILLLYIFVDFIAFPLYTRHADEFDLIDIAELPLEEAKSKLEALDLELIVRDSAFSPIVERGYVITQLPKAFSRVKTGRRVYVSVSNGSKPALVPSIKGLSIKDARFRLQAAGLEIRNTLTAHSKNYPKNVVMNQSKEQGTELLVGDSINVTVSLGADFRSEPMPNYVERMFAVASKDVQKLGLRVTREKAVGEFDYLPGTIVRQSIPAGTRLEDQTEIIFWVVQK